MPTQAGFEQVESLVNKFKSLSSRARQGYNEADTRKEFGVEEYVTRFEELWWLSRPAMAEGVMEALERQIARLDAAIDQAVYRLYGLTKQEIAVVEGRQPV